MAMTNKNKRYEDPKKSAFPQKGKEKEVSEDVYANSGGQQDFQQSDSKDFVDLYENIFLNDKEVDIHMARSVKGPMISETSQIKGYRLAVMCLVLLCFLLLTAIPVLWVKLTAERDQLQTSYNNLTKDRDQLLTRYSSQITERDELKEEKDRLHQKLSRLEDAFKMYHITTEKKSWIESRKDCRARGADLVIINSEEEQEIIGKLFSRTEAWIGLTDSAKEGEWKWVDDTTLSTEFWWEGEPNDFGGNEDCTITGYKSAKSDLRTWADFPCNHPVLGICEF